MRLEKLTYILYIIAFILFSVLLFMLFIIADENCRRTTFNDTLPAIFFDKENGILHLFGIKIPF